MNKKKISLLSIIAAIILVFSFAGCTKPKNGELTGLIQAKTSYSGRMVISSELDNSQDGYIIEYKWQITYPERFSVLVRLESGLFEEIWVSEAYYETINKGDEFVYNDSYCYSEEPCTKILIDMISHSLS